MNSVFPVKFKLQEAPSGEPIVGAFVSIWDKDFVNLIVPNITTDENGFALIGLPDGKYNAIFFYEGFNFPNTIFFNVEDAPLSFTVDGDVSVVSPLVRGYTLLYGYTTDISSKPLFDSIIKVRVNPTPQYTRDRVLSKEDYTLYTDENGYFEVSLLGGVKVTVTIPSCGFQTVGMLPPSGKINVTDLDKQFTQI